MYETTSTKITCLGMYFPFSLRILLRIRTWLDLEIEHEHILIQMNCKCVRLLLLLLLCVIKRTAEGYVPVRNLF